MHLNVKTYVCLFFAVNLLFQSNIWIVFLKMGFKSVAENALVFENAEFHIRRQHVCSNKARKYPSAVGLQNYITDGITNQVFLVVQT